MGQKINNEKLEELLRESLKNGLSVPSDELNNNLKRAVRIKASGKMSNLYYLPLIAAILLSICLFFFVVILISSVIVRAMILGSIIFSLLSICILTVYGIKNLN